MPSPSLRTVPELHDVGSRYEAAEGRASILVLPPEPDPPPPPARRISLRQGWRLLRTPASEQGVIQYYRVLLDRAPDPEVITGTLKALRLGRVMRLDVLLHTAYSQEASEQGLGGPGRTLIRVVAALARHSRLASYIRLKRQLALASAVAERSERADIGSPLAPEVARLKQAVAQLGDSAGSASSSGREITEIEDRLSAIEAALLEVLNARAEALARKDARST